MRKAAEAIAVFEKASKSDPPDYALLAATRAYRDLGRYDEAARLARDGARLASPARGVWPLLLSLVLSDAGAHRRGARGIAHARRPSAPRPSSG